MLNRKPSASAAAGAAYPAGKESERGPPRSPPLGRAAEARRRGTEAGVLGRPERCRVCRTMIRPPPAAAEPGGPAGTARWAPASRCCAGWRVRLGGAGRGEGGNGEKSRRETTQGEPGIAASAGAAAFDEGQRCSPPLPAADLGTPGGSPAAPGFRRARRLGGRRGARAAVQPRGVRGAAPARSPG